MQIPNQRLQVAHQDTLRLYHTYWNMHHAQRLPKQIHYPVEVVASNDAHTNVLYHGTQDKSNDTQYPLYATHTLYHV